MSGTVTLYGVIFTGDDEATTEHSVHYLEADAVKAGAKLARRQFAELSGAYDGQLRVPGDDESDWAVIDALRTETDCRLEIEPVEIGIDVIRALSLSLVLE